MKYLSICSGIEAASVAWGDLGFEAVAFAETEAFPSAVLRYHYPTVPNWGDITKFKGWPDARYDILVGGTPCQSFSVAGLRKGLADPRGNLALVYLAIADRYRPRWLVWENVPGVLSSNGGRDFGAFLGGLAQLGYGFAYRVLDAQYFGVPQRRRRIFVVGHLGDWRRAAAVLFERHSLSGDTPPGRTTGEGTTHPIAPSLGASGRGFERAGDPRGQDAVVAHCLNSHGGSHGRIDAESETFIAHTLKGEGFDASEDGTGRGTPLIADTVRSHLRPGSNSVGALCFTAKDYGADAGETAPTLRSGDFDGSHANGGVMPAVALYDDPRRFDARGVHGGFEHGVHPPLNTVNSQQILRQQSTVRRLTPRECERLQGFPDDYTAITYRGKPAADGPRYKALGNSMAVPVMKWIGARL